MAELLTHVLAGLIIATIASWRYAWITPPLVVACMVGAAIPDLNRIDLVLPADTITALIGLPWTSGELPRAVALSGGDQLGDRACCRVWWRVGRPPERNRA